MGEIGNGIETVFGPQAAELAGHVAAAAEITSTMQQQFAANTAGSANEGLEALKGNLERVAGHLGEVSIELTAAEAAKRKLLIQWGIDLDNQTGPVPETVTVTDAPRVERPAAKDKPAPQPLSAHRYRAVYEALGVDLSTLGCIMVDTDPIPVSDIIPEDALYYAKDPEKYPHMKGIVSETVPHATLLFGLMNHGPEIKEQVDKMLEGWSIDGVTIDHVSYFEDPKPGEPQYLLIAHLDVNSGLSEANSRLQMLPHINLSPPHYKPHISLAYIKHDPALRDRCIEALNARLAGKRINVRGLNYGW